MAGNCLGIDDFIRSVLLEEAFQNGLSIKKSRTTGVHHRNLVHYLPRDGF